ncbi:SDR family NAD(P)-dependent oxidoreductase [Streptomyces sp. TRM68367]|nr:SDR family NAD(P)-dependent oxidoreductase [Streptomyces sp. TRM68367]
MTDTRRFEGYGVLITGAARGIGAATARRFAAEGARVLVADADLAEAEKTAALLRDEGVAAEGFACDVADRAAGEAAVAYAAAAFGSLDVCSRSAVGGTAVRPAHARSSGWSEAAAPPAARRQAPAPPHRAAARRP